MSAEQRILLLYGETGRTLRVSNGCDDRLRLPRKADAVPRIAIQAFKNGFLGGASPFSVSQSGLNSRDW